jgi:hypothetical protein
MQTCRCGLVLGVGVCLCGIAIAADHAFEFRRPSDMACTSPVTYRDLARLAGCDNSTLPHNRMGWFTSVAIASTTSTATYVNPIFLKVPLVAFTAKGAEDAAERAAEYDRMGTIVGSSLPVSSLPVIVLERGPTFNLVHPTNDEQVALIRQSSGGLKGEET